MSDAAHSTTRAGLDSSELDDDAPLTPGLRTRRGRFVLDGRTILLVSAGTTGVYAPDSDENGHLLRVLDSLSELGSDTYAFRIRLNPWTFCWDQATLRPWASTGAPFDVTEWNDAFWSSAGDLVREAANRGILTEFVLFDARSLRLLKTGGWPKNPFNGANGGPIARVPIPAFYHIADPANLTVAKPRVAAPGRSPETSGQALQWAQQQFVRRAVEALDGQQTVTWEIVSGLDGSDPIRVGFVSHFIDLLRQADSLDRLVSFSSNRLRRTDGMLYRMTGIDTVQFPLDADGYEMGRELAEAVGHLREYGKPVVISRAKWSGEQARLHERASIWQAFLAGGHPAVRTTIDAGTTDNTLRAFLQFVAACDPKGLEYAGASAPVHAGNVTAHSAFAQDQGVVYAVTEGGYPGGPIPVPAPQGEWSYTLYSPETGRETPGGRVTLGESEIMDFPPFEGDIAARFTRVPA